MPAIGPETVNAITEVVHQAGRRVFQRFSSFTPPRDREEVIARIQSGGAASVEVLRPGLERACPGAGWVDDELEEGSLPSGDWWVIDPIEGAINYGHGMTDWCVSATLVRDNEPLAAVVSVPQADETFVAVRGGGAHLASGRLRVSGTADLSGAMVGTGQASPRDDAETRMKLGRSAHEMLYHALTTRVSVPATWQLIQVAAGRTDAFWQFSGVLSGLCAGALLVREAGGRVTDVQGEPWRLGSANILASAPGIHGEMLSILSSFA